jgi:YaiO family outer membrane protein
MRTALFAGLVAGTFLLNALPADAAESSFRGLKLPRSTLEAHGLADRGPALRGLSPGLFEAGPALAPRASFFEGSTDTHRLTFGSTDYRTALYMPTGRAGGSARLAGFGPALDVAPRSILSLQAGHALPGGFGLGLGVRQSEYSHTAAGLMALSAERQWGSIRGGYTLYAHWLDGSSAGSAHRFQLSYAYGERNTIGLSYTTGRDVESLALPAGASFADVRDLALTGRHWLSTNWALTYDLREEQSVLYRRQGLRLGVSRSF